MSFTILATWKEPGEVSVQAAQTRLNQGGNLLDALESGLIAAEDDPRFIAIGRASLPNSDGELELDASIMTGDTLECGAVCGVRGILPIISLARHVMNNTPHVMLCGDNARRYAIEHGWQPQNLMGQAAIEKYEEFLVSPEAASRYVHIADNEPPHDTVTMLGAINGKTGAASSTSGMPFKIPGRVGDSPIVGAGIYADDEAGAAGATGWGEQLWKACASFRTVQNMRNGMSPQEACEETIRYMLRRIPGCDAKPNVVLAVNPQGDFGAAICGGTFHLWALRDGQISCHEYLSLS
jgi:isoaspartyl peptidase/L-asparaginase-like protein (Ntn-hydrolase superfamily)